VQLNKVNQYWMDGWTISYLTIIYQVQKLFSANMRTITCGKLRKNVRGSGLGTTPAFTCND